ncbi:hypothetical protein [Lactococcus petauri]|nr:hypothetical protein [Lactococcus petauri]MDT2585245.1 hypothetical protein [Lactococcus petauri]MDT2666215.1 hypothetical protein [Lactococcus petauri]
MGISRETEDRRLKEKTSSDFQRSRILSRKEIENEVVYDAFFDPKAAPDSKLVITRVLNVLGIIIVWLVTFLPGIITLWQVFWT